MAAVAGEVGQHFIVDFPGLEVTPGVERLVREGRIGGVILFAKNVASAAQVRALTAALQRLAAEAGVPPLLICVDQEGGAVNRITDGVPILPGAMALGAGGRAEDAAEAGRITARALRRLGINTDHAPVLDVNINPQNPIIGIRAFGEDPAEVARLGCAYLGGLQGEGVLGTVKHFPGHGGTAVDSHLALPVVDKSLEGLRREELLPFARAIHAGADGVMAAHIVFAALDPQRPASLSAPVLRHLLRDALGFGGVVFTDAMSMKAVTEHWSPGEAAVAALAAGADLVLACGAEGDQWASLRAAGEALAGGGLDRQDLAASAARIARVKAAYVRPEETAGSSAARADLEAADGIAARAVTLVRSQRGRIPLAPGRTAVVAAGESAVEPAAVLHAELARRRSDVHAVPAAEVRDGDRWPNVVAVSMAWRSEEGALVVADLVRRVGDRLVVVGAGAPYELARVPQVATYVAAYGPDAPSLRAAARVLTGNLLPSGRLPVTIPGLHPRGHRAAV